MGACTFTQIGFGKTAADAYRNACDEAIREYGHQDGYNGTISTTHGFTMVDAGRRDPEKVAWEQIDRFEKWGPCGCIELTGKRGRDAKERAGLKGTRKNAYLFFGWAAE